MTVNRTFQQPLRFWTFSGTLSLKVSNFSANLKKERHYMVYDLIVVGAGPAGLLAAKTSAGKGLKVLLLERKPDPKVFKRSNTCMLVATPGFHGEEVRVEKKSKKSYAFNFIKSGFSVNYNGPLYKVNDMISFSPGGFKVHVHNKKEPLYHLFDNKTLLSELIDETVKSGVTLRTGALAIKAENKDGSVRICIREEGGESWVEGKKAIVAEGLKSRLAQYTGVNSKRKLYGRGPGLQYLMDGIKYPFKEKAFMTFYGSAYSKGGGLVYIAPSAEGKDCFYVGISGVNPSKYCKIFLDEFIKNGKFREWFDGAKITESTGAVVHLISPLPVPIAGNILFAADSVGYAETMYQGAFMCGFHAANGVYDELNGKGGFENYTKFWQSSFKWNITSQAMANYLKIGFLFPFFSDAELDYIFGLVDGKTFEGIMDPYENINGLFEIITRQPEIKLEISQKLKIFQKITMEDIEKMIIQKREFAKNSQS